MWYTAPAFCWSEPTSVTVELYNVLGQRVDTMHDGVLQAGQHLLPIDTGQRTAGVYYVRVSTDEETVVRLIQVLN